MLHNVLDHGAAVGASARQNQRAFQAAIDAAHAAGGGTVYIPAGRFVSGTVSLRSNVTLHLAAGALLMGSTDHKDYRFSDARWPWVHMAGIPDTGAQAGTTGLIMAIDAENIAIEGHGTIDGNGQGHVHFPAPTDPHQRRPMLLYFDRCKNIRVTDVRLRHPAMFTIWCARSRKVVIRGVDVYSWETENGDGFDFNGSSDVSISDCFIEAGDDAISLKTPYRGFPCRNYAISNCVMRSRWAAFRMGTESSADMSEIVLSNCVFENCNDGIKIQDCSQGVLENVRVSNVVMRGVHRPVFITVGSFRLSRDDVSIRPPLGGLRGIRLHGITARMPAQGEEYQRNCFVISGCPGKPVEDVRISDCQFIFDGPMHEGALGRVDVPELLDYTFMYADVFSINGDYPAAGMFLRHIDGIAVRDCQLLRAAEDPRPMVFASAVRAGLLRDVEASGTPLLLQCVDAEFALSGCRSNGAGVDCAAPLSAEQTERYRSFVDESRAVDALFARSAQMVDRAESLARMETLPDKAWEKSRDIWRAQVELSAPTVMLWLVTYGEVELWINGAPDGASRLPRLYRNMHCWAVDASALVRRGMNELELRWLDPGDRGGIACKLPFGVFEPLSAGLLAPLRIYSEGEA